MNYLGYILSTTNKGTTWTQTNFTQDTYIGNNDEANDASYKWYGQKMAIDPSNPNHVLVGTPDEGLLVSTDGGTTWSTVSGVPAGTTAGGISGILFDPASTTIMYAASYGNGVYESTNGDTSWSKLTSGTGPSNVRYAAISSAGVYYAISADNNVWQYASSTWTEILTGSGPGGVITTVAVNPSDANEVIVADGEGNLNESTNAGSTWSGWTASSAYTGGTDIPWQSLVTPYSGIYSAFFNPLNTGQLVAASQNDFLNLTIPGSVSGSHITWNSQGRGIEQLVANDIVVPNTNAPVVASWDRPFFYKGGGLYTYPSTFGPNGSTEPTTILGGWSLDYAASDPSFVVGIADGEAGPELSGYSTNGGQTWNAFGSYPSGAGSGNFIAGSIAVGSSTDFVWAPAQATQPYYTTDGGNTWTGCGSLPGSVGWNNWAYYSDGRDVTADRVLPGTYYYFSSSAGSIFKSTNSCATWALVNSSVPGFGNYAGLQSVPGEADNLFLSSGWSSADASGPIGNHFLRSTDGGSTWSAVPNVEDVYTYGFGAAAPGQSYPAIYIVGFVNQGSGYTYGIWESNDNASTWRQLGPFAGGTLDRITTISGDPDIYGQVYVGFTGSGYAVLAAATPSVSFTAPASGATVSGSVTLSATASKIRRHHPKRPVRSRRYRRRLRDHVVPVYDDLEQHRSFRRLAHPLRRRRRYLGQLCHFERERHGREHGGLDLLHLLGHAHYDQRHYHLDDERGGVLDRRVWHNHKLWQCILLGLLRDQPLHRAHGPHGLDHVPLPGPGHECSRQLRDIFRPNVHDRVEQRRLHRAGRHRQH